MKLIFFCSADRAAFVAFGFPGRPARQPGKISAKRPDEREVVLSTTTNSAEAGSMARQFKAKYPFLEVNYKSGRKAKRIVTRVLQEARAKKPCGCHSNTWHFICTR